MDVVIREYESAGGIVIHEDRLLVLDRPSRQEIRLPKGHIEEGEEPADTAVREVGEEAGVAGLEIIQDLGDRTVEFDYNGERYRRREFYFLMRLMAEVEVERPALDVTDFYPMWIPLDRAVDMLTYEAEKQAAQRGIDAYRARATGYSSRNNATV